MNLQLSHSAAKAFFPALLDQELPAPEEAKVRGHLAECPSCNEGFVKYERAVMRVRNLERIRAPDLLATRILQRTKKRRGLRQIARVHAEHRVPVEILIPILMAAAVAAWLMLAL